MNNPHKHNSQVGRTWSRQKGALERLLKWPKPDNRMKAEINTLKRRLGLSKQDIADAKNKGKGHGQTST